VKEVNIAAFVLADTWGMHGDDVGWGWWIVMTFGMVVFWGALILGIVWLIRGSFEGWRGGREARRETPLETLDRRFAEGSISVEDYHHRRDVITSDRQSHQPAGS
jgi:putative membrane protein